jgi:hypothetical protein
MASCKTMNGSSRYGAGMTWGDSVRVRPEAAAEARPGATASVCGIRKVETREQGLEYGVTIGTTLYLIEFDDGTSIEVPEAWLEACDDVAVQ